MWLRLLNILFKLLGRNMAEPGELDVKHKNFNVFAFIKVGLVSIILLFTAWTNMRLYEVSKRVNACERKTTSLGKIIATLNKHGVVKKKVDPTD